MNILQRCAVAGICVVACCGMAPGQEKQKTVAADSRGQTDCGPSRDPAFAVCRGPWSGKTISLFNTWTFFDQNPERRLRFPSPDGKKVIKVRGPRVRLVANGKTYWTPLGNMHDAELAWAPDSSRFFVTWSETGELGLWSTQVYAVDESGIHELSGVQKAARQDFQELVRKLPIPKQFRTPEGRRYWSELEYCEPHDVIGSQWLNGSEELLLAVRVRNVSMCRYASTFRAYRVNAATGQILERYTEEEAHKAFGDGDLPRILDTE